MKTLSRVYDTYGQASSVVTELEAAGVPNSEISLLANKHVSAAMTRWLKSAAPETAPGSAPRSAEPAASWPALA